jgi:hypothetical protein
MSRLKIGDIFEIPLSNNKKAYGQYIYLDFFGPLIRVFNLIVDVNKQVDIDVITSCKLLFPPVYTGVKAAIKNGMWSVIGNKEIHEFVFPGFVRTFQDLNTGDATIWFLWDGKNNVRIGKKLSDDMKKFEFLAIYSPDLIEKRIISKEKPYQDLILTNKLAN